MRGLVQQAGVLSRQLTQRKATSYVQSSTCILPFRQQSTSECSRNTIEKWSRPSNTLRKSVFVPRSTTQTRLSSSTAPSVEATTTSVSATPQPLTWNRFLEIRKVRRRINVVASVIGVGGALFLSMYVISSQDVDVLAQKYLGLDALITMGLIVVGTSAAGWLIGPIFGNAIFNIRYRALRPSILEKEKEFFQRIARHRVDPTRSSYQNPVPDYYGEKIGSLRDYRRWLKDQRAFNLKRAG